MIRSLINDLFRLLDLEPDLLDGVHPDGKSS